MSKYICETCAGMGDWFKVESDSTPADDEHKHGWREATEEEEGKATEQTMDEHEEVHKKMMHGGM